MSGHNEESGPSHLSKHCPFGALASADCRPLARYVVTRFDAISSDEDEVEFEPAILYGATDRFAVELRSHYEKPTGSSGEWGYAAGVRHTFGEKHGLGLELMGSLESEGSSEAMVGYYGEFSERITLNAGIGTGIDNGPDGTARLGFIWRFK